MDLKFRYTTERLEAENAWLECFEVPWDSEILGFPVGQIAQLSIDGSVGADEVLDALFAWKRRHGIRFASCRLPHDQILEANLLQERGYRFIELNFQPEIELGPSVLRAEPEFTFELARETDRAELAGLAENIFRVGRFHSDPKLGVPVGNKRYRAWMENAFELPHQEVVKCVIEGRIGACFVIENKGDCSFWSLVGLRPDLQGKGIGKRVWTDLMVWQYRQDVRRVRTSISSLNTAVLNLYARLGFHFPAPDLTLHWHEDAR